MNKFTIFYHYGDQAVNEETIYALDKFEAKQKFFSKFTNENIVIIKVL